MTDRELMQMALDALEYAADEIGCPNDDDSIGIARKALRARLAGWERVNMHDHKEGDLSIGTKPYAAQAAMVAQQTQGRMYVDPVTGDAGIGTVKWDASAPLVVHPHPAFQATQPQPDLAAVGEVGIWGERQWQGLTDAEIRGFEIWLDDEEEKHGWNPPADIVKYIEAKLKERNT